MLLGTEDSFKGAQELYIRILVSAAIFWVFFLSTQANVIVKCAYILDMDRIVLYLRHTIGMVLDP